MKRISWLVLLLVFSLALAACGGDEPAEEQPTQAEAPVAANESEPALVVAEETAVKEAATEELEEIAETEEEVPSEMLVALSDLEFSSLDELTSYRYDMVIDMVATDAAGAEVTQSMQMILAVSADPPAMSMTMTTEGQEELADMGNLEFVQTADTNYIVMGEMGCMALPTDAESAIPTDELMEGFTPESLMEDLENVTLVGEETINGVETLHYTYDETSMEAENMVGIESMVGHIFLAKNGGYLVRSIVDIVGNSKYMADMAVEGVQSGTTHIEMNLQDVNENVEVLVPAACEGQDAAADVEWPMLDDASEVSAIAGILSYTTETSGNDAMDFYNDAMVELGYTLDEESSFVAEGNGLLTFVHTDGTNVSITIAEDVETGLTTVTVLGDASR